MPTVDAEIRVGGKHEGLRKHLGHADEAGISEAHGHVGISAHERKHWLLVIGEAEGDLK